MFENRDLTFLTNVVLSRVKSAGSLDNRLNGINKTTLMSFNQKLTNQQLT